MFDDPEGPVEHFSWGKFIVAGDEHSSGDEGKVGVGKDIRCVGKKVSEWKERKGHVLSPAMITGVYDQEIEVLVIGIGVYGAVVCPEDVRRAIRKHGIQQVILLNTPEACRTYNLLTRQGKRAALLAHGTC